MRAGAVAVAAGALALALATAPSDAAAGRCTPAHGAIAGVPHSKVLATKGASVVYRVRGRSADTWWACLRGSARRALVGTDDSFQDGGSEYGPTRTLGNLRQGIGGWVSVVEQTGHVPFEACSKYMQYPCPSPTDRLLAVQAASREPGPGTLAQVQTDTSDATGAGTTTGWSAIVISGGAIAWLLRSQAYSEDGSAAPIDTLYGCVATAARGSRPACTPQQYAQGTIAPASVTLASTKLSWTQNGQQQAAALP